MGDKKKAKEIVRSINKTKKRVAGKLDKRIEKNQHLFSILVPIFAGLLFFIFSILFLNGSVWFEESYAKYATQGSFGDIFNVAIADGRSPLFYFVLKMWSSIFGTGEIALRFMSIFFGLLSIVFLFQLTKKWFGIKAASMATVLVAISPMFVRASQEIGSYTFMLFIFIIATYIFSNLVSKKAKNAKKKKKYWVIYILFAPWVINLLFNTKAVLGNGTIVPFSGIFDFVSSALFLNNGTGVTGWGVVFGVSLLVSAIVAITAVYKKASVKNKGKLQVVLAMIILPLVVMTILSLPPLPGIFNLKNVFVSMVAIWVLFGIMFSMMKATCFKNILMVLMLVVAGIGIFNVETRKTEGHMAEILAETFIGAKEGEPIVIKDSKNFYDGVFYTNDQHPIYVFADEMAENESSDGAIKYYKMNLIENKEDFLKEHESVWYVIDTPAVGAKYEIPKWAEKMRITSEISLDHHTALEFTK